MQLSPQDKDQLERLGPSKVSGSGFLGNDHRPLEEIVADDLRTLEDRGVDIETFVERLKRIYQTARGAFGGEVDVGPGLTAVWYDAKGEIPSPFRGDGRYEKGEAVVEQKATGKVLILTALSIHLVEKFGFFQGHGSRYRIDPATAIDLLGL